jgi:signal transduction histidine kinase
VSARQIEEGPIIVIDDDEALRRACHAALGRSGYRVEIFPDGPLGLKRMAEVGAGLLVVDLKMPGMSGMEVIEQAKRIDPDVVAIVITGFATVSTAVEAMKAGAYDFIPKPFTADELRVIIARGVERRRLALEANRLRKEKETQARKFVTFVSHQLRAPLGAVRQYLDVLCHQAGDAISTQHREWIERCRGKITDMLAMIEDWLTISRVEGGQLATRREPVRWGDLAAEVLEALATTARDKDVSSYNELPPDLPPVVGDRTALKMALSNLVINAVKYNRPGGKVTITSDIGPKEIGLSISDTGMGIAPADQDRVFEEFYRAPGTAATGEGGTGMGLPICKRIVEELGGRLTLSSNPGKGSTFTIVLPRALD